MGSDFGRALGDMMAAAFVTAIIVAAVSGALGWALLSFLWRHLSLSIGWN